jgi:hypothetical protein
MVAQRRIAERYAERPPATIDIATDVVDLAQLETLAERWAGPIPTGTNVWSGCRNGTAIL